MKQFALFFFFGFVAIYSNSYAQIKIPTLELHLSGNHALKKEKEDRTFFGGGFGANVVFGDTRIISFKTGLEANFFHTWNDIMLSYKETYKTNAHYNYWDLSIPLMFRLNVGEKMKFFVEAGGYFSIPLIGNVTTTNIYYGPPGMPGISSVVIERKEYKSFLSLSAAGSVGGIFPVSKRTDLIVKPEFVFRKGLNIHNFLGYMSDDVNEQFFYVRLCLGVRVNLNQETE